MHFFPGLDYVAPESHIKLDSIKHIILILVFTTLLFLFILQELITFLVLYV